MGVQAGQVLAGKYRVERVLGQGGMGMVVAATHLGSGTGSGSGKPPEPGLPEPLAAKDVTGPLSVAANKIDRCSTQPGGVGGKLRAELTINGEGRVTKLALIGPPAEPYDAAACMRSVLLALRFPRWKGPSTTVSKTYVVRGPVIDSGGASEGGVAAVVAPPKPPPDQDPAALFQAAKTAYSSGQYAASLHLAEQALAISPGDQGTRTLAAFSACSLKDATKARRHIHALSTEQRRSAARQVCARNGVTVED